MAQKIVDVIHEYVFFNKKIILLLVSHNPEEISKICDRVILLKQGEIISDISLKGDYPQKLQQIESMVQSDV